MADWDFINGLGDAAGGFLGSIGAFIGDAFGEEDRKRARDYLARATDAYRDVDPTVVAQREDALHLGPTAFEAITLDPQARLAQERALRSLMETGLSGGLDAQSRARYALADNEVSQAEAAQRGAILQNAQARGVAGSGLELASQLASQQGAATRRALAGTQAAGDASQRALESLARGGVLAGEMRGQDYQQEADKASARDIIARHNLENSQGVRARNADRAQSAQQSTVSNRLARADGMASGYRGQAGGEYSEEERKRRLGYGVGSGVGRAGGTAAGLAAGGF